MAKTPLVRAFKIAAFLEGLGWLMLLTAMYLKYGTDFGPKGVQIAGPIHGVFFIAYVLTTLKLWQDHEWPMKEFILGLVSSVIPFMTVWFEKHAEKNGLLAPAVPTHSNDLA